MWTVSNSNYYLGKMDFSLFFIYLKKNMKLKEKISNAIPNKEDVLQRKFKIVMPRVRLFESLN